MLLSKISPRLFNHNTDWGTLKVLNPSTCFPSQNSIQPSYFRFFPIYFSASNQVYLTSSQKDGTDDIPGKSRKKFVSPYHENAIHLTVLFLSLIICLLKKHLRHCSLFILTNYVLYCIKIQLCLFTCCFCIILYRRI